MDKNDILQKIEKYKLQHYKKYGFNRVGIFGSFTRNTATGLSDIDIIVEQIKPDLFILGTIKDDLEHELGIKVDIIRLRDGMSDFLRRRIEQEAIYV
ncbi:MAG: nucleotidyltransferase [Desulfobacteraceae bacterium]|nr:nucleotidyltransferase [Desulfobacteraceae bacterium]